MLFRIYGDIITGCTQSWVKQFSEFFLTKLFLEQEIFIKHMFVNTTSVNSPQSSGEFIMTFQLYVCPRNEECMTEILVIFPCY